MDPAAVGQRSGQVIKDKLHRYRGRQGRIPERQAITQLQPRRPVGEGAAVAAHGIGRGTGGDKGGRGVLGVFGENMQVQWRFVDQEQLVCDI
ncbi:hypothetical protein D3C86_2031210 [compost metagenome]